MPPALDGTPQRRQNTPITASSSITFEIAPQRQLHAAGGEALEVVAGDRRDHRLGQQHTGGSHGSHALGLEGRRPGAGGEAFEVVAGAEGAVAAVEHPGLGLGVSLEGAKGSAKLARRLRVHGIAPPEAAQDHGGDGTLFSAAHAHDSPRSPVTGL